MTGTDIGKLILAIAVIAVIAYVAVDIGTRAGTGRGVIDLMDTRPEAEAAGRQAEKWIDCIWDATSRLEMDRCDRLYDRGDWSD